MKNGVKSENRQPLVSVVIPCYNAARTITRAIQSALEQDYDRLEILVADDGSTDSTREVVCQLHDPRVTFLPSSVNRGAAAARNTAIRHATGTYVAFLDADDAWLPGKISRQVRLMQEHPNARIATGDCLFFDAEGRAKHAFFQRRTPYAGENAWCVLLAYNFVGTSAVLARRTDVVELGGFCQDLPTGEDQDLWIRLATLGELVVVPEILVHYHNQPTSLSKKYRDYEPFLLLEMIGNHLRRQAYRLREEQIRSIWGERLFDIAANLLHNGDYGRSAPLFWNSLRCGFRPLKSLVNLARAAGYGIFRRNSRRNLNLSVWRESASKAVIPVRREPVMAIQKGY